MAAAPDVDPAPEPFSPDADLSTLAQLEGELAELQAALTRVDGGDTDGTDGADGAES